MQTKDQEVKTLDDVVQGQPDEATTQPQESVLPEKYRGKSVEDIVKMHQEAERLAGRHAQEVGELRKLADEYIKSNLTPKGQEQEEPDFFVDPQRAIKRTLETDPLIKSVAEKTKAIEAKLNKQALEQAHPDFNDIIDDEKFQQWVSESKYRMQLYQTANNNWDFDAANELFDTWKQLNKTVATEKETRKQEVKRGSVGSGNATTDVDAGSTRKIYRRADIIKLMQTDPKRYSMLQPEIMKAYQEGRVR